MIITDHEATLVEWHDARLQRFTLDAAGAARLEFAHLSLVLEDGDEVLETWSSEAVLELAGVDRISVTGIWEEREFVSDGELTSDASSGLPQLRHLQRGVPATAFRLLFTHRAATLEVSCRRAQLRDLRVVERID